MRNNGKYVREVARELIDTKRENMRNGERGKDVLSLLGECFQKCWRFADWLSIKTFGQSRGVVMLTVK